MVVGAMSANWLVTEQFVMGAQTRPARDDAGYASNDCAGHGAAVMQSLPDGIRPVGHATLQTPWYRYVLLVHDVHELRPRSRVIWH